ncbi:MAG: NAD(P)H-hydrate dehydratase [Acidimicrobiales bacterium]
MIGIGIDAVDVARFRVALARTPRLAARLFTDGELGSVARSADPVPRLAARFAAKEAVMKALGVGLGAFGLREVEVVRADSGRPSLLLSGAAAALAGRQRVATWHLSMTHDGRGGGGGPARPVIPVLTPEETRALDASAPESEAVLIERAGSAVARAALRRLGGGYGRRVVVVAGKGNNGADGRAAAARLRRRGVRVEVLDAAPGAAPASDGGPPAPARGAPLDAAPGAAPASAPPRLPPADLVIDAAYGTGFRGSYQAPDPSAAPVLAVDIPSGVDGLTGQAGPGAVAAAATVTFAALKPGLLLGAGAELAGEVELADIGLAAGARRMARAQVLEDHDVAAWLEAHARRREASKWDAAVWVVAGSPGMTGAARLCAGAAMRAGAGTVRLGIPGTGGSDVPLEVVGRPLPQENWDAEVLAELSAGRFHALVVGPGLGRSGATAGAVRRLVAGAPVPVVLDADGLHALGTDPEAAREVLAGRRHPTVLTPHDGEFARLAGRSGNAGGDRIGSVRDLAARTGAVVLRKGSLTTVSDPGGEVRLTVTGDSRLATAGTGDVLSGVLGAFLARGLDALEAAGAAAHVHGLAARLGWREGLVAGDVVELLPGALQQLSPPAGGASRREARW